MKRNEWMALIVTSFMMFAVCLSASAKTKKIVERGMTKQEVIEIMGQPAYKLRRLRRQMGVLQDECLNRREQAYSCRL